MDGVKIMKYIINYNEQGKILGFTKGDTDLNIEVSNSKWVEAQSFNKIIIDGKNISFEKVDWRTAEEIKTAELNTQIAEAKQYLVDTDHKFYGDYEPKADEDLELVRTKRSEARAFVRANKEEV